MCTCVKIGEEGKKNNVRKQGTLATDMAAQHTLKDFQVKLLFSQSAF